MSNDYTPTTDEVRTGYARDRWLQVANTGPAFEQWRAEFTVDSRLVVIDPATADVEALQAAIDGANGGAEARAVLQFFGIEVPR